MSRQLEKTLAEAATQNLSVTATLETLADLELEARRQDFFHLANSGLLQSLIISGIKPRSDVGEFILAYALAEMKQRGERLGRGVSNQVLAQLFFIRHSSKLRIPRQASRRSC